MGKALIAFAGVAIYVYTLIDLIRAPRDQVRVMPKWLWAVIVVLFSLLGAALWFAFGRPRAGFPPSGGGGSGGGGGGGGLGAGPRSPRPMAPDDDPEFLKRLDEQSWAARMERLRRERQGGGAGGAGGPSGAGSPGEGPDGNSP